MDENRRNLLKVAGSLAGYLALPASSAFALAPNEPSVLQGAQPNTVSVLSFGAKGDGAADDTAAVQKAIDSAAMIFFPPGVYRISSVAINTSGKYVYGAYKKSQITAIGNETLLTARGSDIRIRDLMFTNAGGSRSGGAFISTFGNFINIDHCHFENGYLGVVTSSTLFTMSDCDFRSFAAAKGICVQINGGFAVTLDKIRSDHPPAAMPFAGINITATGDTTISNSGIINCGSNLLVNPGPGKVVASVYASNTFFDTAIRGIALVPGERGAIVRAHFVNCWASSHTEVGTLVDSGKGLVDGVTFMNHQANLNGADGISILGSNTFNIQLLGGEMAQNKGSGIAVGPKSSKFYLQNLLAGAVHGLKGNEYGIKIGPGCSDYQVVNCICQNNRVGQIVDESKSGSIHDNIGFTSRSSGAAFIFVGETSVVVNHGLGATPQPADISITPTSARSSNSVFLDVASVGPMSFTVRCASSAAEKLHFVWQARCLGA